VYLHPADKYRRLTRRLSQGQKDRDGGLSWHLSGPLNSDDVLEAGRAGACRHLRPLPVPFPTTACVHPRWLQPGRHAKAPHRALRPDVLRPSRGLGGRPRLPALGCAMAGGRCGLGQRQTEARLGQTEIAQFITLCRVSNQAEAWRLSSPLQGSSPATTRASSRPSRAMATIFDLLKLL
jgi:hypothetical protein